MEAPLTGSHYVLRTIPRTIDLKTYSDRIVGDALAWYRRNPDVYGVPVYEPPQGRYADGLSISIGHAISRARHRGTMPCVGHGSAMRPVIFARSQFDERGHAVVAVYRRPGDWRFPDPDAYGAQLADELQHELLTQIAHPPCYLDFTGLKSFRDKVLPRPELAGTDDFAVRRTILHQLQAWNLIEVYDAENPQGLPYPVKALRLTPTGWNALEPEGEAA